MTCSCIVPMFHRTVFDISADSGCQDRQFRGCDDDWQGRAAARSDRRTKVLRPGD
ncbi:uncharacterized protein B0I36DRAFT_309112 [Microdochium trichocladiopsis]|uniref:Uncharacterized protein n=1 Tax=Microdochium trichocladiopsis TaxID=1682393 RepID=A0A9P8YFR9_9PEZI|nr:uncharacterized protein B0I36DRAFT_309112 [Microdochium trichocladiopsis]KAH7039696.1 hypothetical protein B0I36DRAFT_309112 [Microdochium trichocladiopsis]